VADETEPGEGNSPAAWVAVIIMLAAIAGGTFAFWFDVPWLVWTCAGLVVVGALVGAVLSKLGYGVKGPRYVPKVHS
jgi:NhaP-type Na+/H+ or K+/H+ antiporter